MRNKKRVIPFILLLTTILSSCGGVTQSTGGNSDLEKDDTLVAHWKFQNLEGCYDGDIETDDLTFIDLSGHGNDLVVSSEGNGERLDVFSWDEGSYYGGTSSLKFNNSLAQAQSVDPYDSSQTSYSGAYVSGKYLETVENAPMNDFVGADGWTIEIIFKVSPEWNNEYNRYVGLFSRQGIQEKFDEPPFAMMLTSAANEQAGELGSNGATGVQYVHIGADEVMAKGEYCNGEIYADEWVHFMIVNEGNTQMKRTWLYVDGEYIAKFTDTSLFSSASTGGWEVGVGRKLGTGEATMNSVYPEGLIRRLFCGSISEIRFSVGKISVHESLIANYI